MIEIPCLVSITEDEEDDILQLAVNGTEIQGTRRPCKTVNHEISDRPARKSLCQRLRLRLPAVMFQQFLQEYFFPFHRKVIKKNPNIVDIWKEFANFAGRKMICGFTVLRL